MPEGAVCLGQLSHWHESNMPKLGARLAHIYPASAPAPAALVLQCSTELFCCSERSGAAGAKKNLSSLAPHYSVIAVMKSGVLPNEIVWPLGKIIA